MTAIPSRFRHPIHDPDPALVTHYRRLFSHGVGSPLPEQISSFAEALQRADPLADAWRADSRGQEGLFELALERRLPSDAPASLRALFDQLESIPLWVDADKMRLGARTARRAGIIGNFVLADFALMGGYRSAAIAKTLVSTGKLSGTAAKRLIHTGRFVHAVSVPGAILPGGEGYLQTVRVRMVHAHVRHALLQSPGWDQARWGIPINQADSLGTNLLFSTGFLEGCKQWGLSFTRDEEEALVHLWRYVGYLMGIEESLLPVDAAGGRRALFMVGVSQPSPDEDSRKLAKALYEVPLTFSRSPGLRRAARFEMAFRLGMTRHLLGDESVDQLGLPRSPYGGLIPPLVRVIRGVERVRVNVPGATAAAYRVGDYAIRASQRLGESALAAHEARSA